MDTPSKHGMPAGLEQLVAGSTMVAAQQPSPSTWSPEKRLAGAILASALVQIRDHHEDLTRKEVIEDLQWIVSDDCTWPFSFVPLCQLFDLDPTWVRMTVRRWLAESVRQPDSRAPHSDSAAGVVTPEEQPHDSRPPWSPPVGSAGSAGDVARRNVHAALS